MASISVTDTDLVDWEAVSLCRLQTVHPATRGRVSVLGGPQIAAIDLTTLVVSWKPSLTSENKSLFGLKLFFREST